MKITLAILLFFALGTAQAQLDKLDLKTVLIVAQLDKPEDRFTMEVNLAELLAESGVKTMVSLNALKQGADITLLSEDSIRKQIEQKGIDTYVLVSVRGFDKKFKDAKQHSDLFTELRTGHLFPIYRDEVTSVTFEFNFYRQGQFVAYDMIKIGSVGSRDDVIKKLRKKLPSRIQKNWK